MPAIKEGYVEEVSLKKQMCLLNPDFDERNFGYQLQDFLREQRDIVDVRHNQTRIR